MKVWRLLLGMALVGCQVETGESFRITEAAGFETDCSIRFDGEFFSSRYEYDIFLDESGFDLPLRIVNDSDVDGRDIQLDGADLCWFREDDPDIVAFDSSRGTYVDCDNVAENQRKRIVSSGNVSAGGGGLATFFRNLLTATDIDAVMDGTFDPTPGSTADRGDLDESNFFDKIGVILQIRARGRLPTGATVYSNWFVFPVDVCAGCNAGACGADLSSPDAALGFVTCINAAQTCDASLGANLTCTAAEDCTPLP